MTKKMRVVLFFTLYPNSVRPSIGIFVEVEKSALA